MRKFLFPIFTLLLVSLFISLPGKTASFKYGGLKLDITGITTSGGTTTLTASSTQVQLASGTATQAYLLPAANTLTPGYWYTVINNTASATVTVKNAGTGVLKELEASSSSTFFLGDNGSINGAWYVDGGLGYNVMDIGPSNDINIASGTIFTKVLTGSITFNIPKRVPGKTVTVRITNPSTYTVSWPSVVRWGGTSHTAPTQTTNGTDVCTLVDDESDIFGSCVQAF